MANICLGNLLPSSVLAYDNIDLIPNGYIPVEGTTARARTRNIDGQLISERETVKLLPSDRIYAEFWYGVSSRVTGTNLGDLGKGVFETLGFLGGGAGAGIGGALACSLQGDSERVISRWVFHVADSETLLNREIILTQENISSKTITLPDYIVGVLGITKSPIVFVTPTIPLTLEQIERAKTTPEDEVVSILGRRISPDQLTDSDMRLLLGIYELNELENLGNSQRGIRGWPQTFEGQIQAEFKNYKYSDSSNLFVKVVRDDRKNHYRADNEFDRADGHCFWNGSIDDLTDKDVLFNLKETEDAVNLKAGDKVYISYVGSVNPIFRHATENITNFFLFPDQSAYQLPPLDLVKGWNFKKFKFNVRKNVNERSVLSDIVNDENVKKEILEIQNNGSISDEEKTRRISSLQNDILLEDMECQRLIESKLEKANRNSFIKGCYFADSRGILSFDFRSGGSPVLLIPASGIADQSWFNNLLAEIQQGSSAFDANGQLIINDADETFFDDFLFDISDHVNMAIYDNEKYGYERRFAKAISKCKIYDRSSRGTGVGFPNLDFIKNQTPGRENYDLTSAKFDSIPMQGSSSLFTCNITFTYDFGFCTKGTIRADMILRTPTFFDKLSTKSRVYVEKFQAQNPLRGDGGIWVGTKFFSEDKYSVTTDPKNYYGCLVYSDADNESTNFRVFEDGVLDSEFGKMKKSDLPSEGHTLPSIDDSLTQNSIKYGGFDKILGDQPGFFNGVEITKENALILMGLIPPSTIKIDNLNFDQTNARINVNGIANRRLRKITIKYIPSKKFLNNKERLLSFVFSSSKSVIDNIGVPYQGVYSKTSRTICVDTRYIKLDNWFIDGDILDEMEILSIEAESISEEDYQKYKIKTSVVSSCFDSSGNWLVFYEDENGGEGSLINDGKSADGSHLTGSLKDGFLPGLQEKSDKEISCLLSSDYGDTWYDFKAVVRTIVGDSVSSPYVVAGDKDRKVHLFYILNESLMHKIIDTSLFDYSDSFRGYKRPNSLNATASKAYGLFHFTSSGIVMRESPSSLVVGNIDGTYFLKQATIISDLKKQKRTDFRIVISGDRKSYEAGLSVSDFISYKESSGQLMTIFTYNGRLYCRGSSDEGLSWQDFIKDGILIHKNSLIQELKPVSLLGFVSDLKRKSGYLTYHVDGMLFIKSFDSDLSIISEDHIRQILNPDSGMSKPVFVVGTLSQELKNAIKNKETNVVFPYKEDVDVFSNAYSISEIASLGYSTSSGLIRFFYKDASGVFRAFSYPETPILDISYSKA